MPSSRATRQARILPSHPREPKPPGTSTPSTPLSSARASSSVMFSASTQRTCTRQPAAMPACFSASCTERYASCSLTYLPTRAISTDSRAVVDPLGQLEPLGQVGLGSVEAELAADQRVEALLAAGRSARDRRRGRRRS